MRTIAGIAVCALLAAGSAACGGDQDGDDQGAADPSPTLDGSPAGGEPERVSAEAEFAPYGPDVEAVTYDEQAVPEGASVEASATRNGAETEFVLAVNGLEPDREFGAHLHTEPCGPNPDDSGPHYQDEPAPEDAANDPEYANDDNEVWLDFTTDAEGTATSDTDVDWEVRPGEANSIVIHAHHTMTEEGHAGEAGDRLGCLNFPM
ncbi:superoxide dismutase family protein [Streptomonospora nanhaiensis]|uniref:Cu-Zn family superoxide dismutase n=1 Tax=Streptomonospora nanhaiensis TaxID=1323731 RepID=A0A853BNQ5_9ACTN|nr:superoxide dismutase family protein [Streptomonospora nanhaiensis]MBV2365925.1 superoxide dismutase family protein [Streptomonospora nanhaiensis]MBX9387765.1 superoxide dismutase family protein [Streptomonospora nanhaiensis]NYI96640.1 Cu-Zn family superoxide dismutase [Streptomonospora nanhaiensis]